MRILIGAVGRLKGTPEHDLVATYVERAQGAGRGIGITAVEVVEQPEGRQQTAAGRRADEARRLLAALPARAAVVALDETGRDVTSAGLAQDLGRFIERGGDVAFLIGGPDGHGEEVRGRAASIIAFGRATWPHRLVRVMLAEQIYRSVTILINHPYHRE